MLPCRSNDSIIFYSLGDPYKYSDIMNIYKEINYFNGKDNRFHTIISKREFNNGSDYFMHEDIENKARMEFEKITGFSEKNEFVDSNFQKGYMFYPYRIRPTIVTYKILYPKLKELFYKWSIDIKTKERLLFSNSIDLSNLIYGIENMEDVLKILCNSQAEKLRMNLFKTYKEFALFYFDIYPYLSFEPKKIIDISKLLEIKNRLIELGIYIMELKEVERNIEISERNSKMFKLLNMKKDT